MSWAGLLRTGDAFCSTRRSRLATLTNETGAPLTRFYGAWSVRHHRFTTNLSSTRILVRDWPPGSRPSEGVQCLIHWVERDDVLRTDDGSVCRGDGWPLELWRGFLDSRSRLPTGSVATQLAAYARSDLDDTEPLASAWRAFVNGGSERVRSERTVLGEGWVPVPARLEGTNPPEYCLISLSPSRSRFLSLTDAIRSAKRTGRCVEPASQAHYHLEVSLAQLHGVRFGPTDRVVDPIFERTMEKFRSLRELRKEEIARVNAPEFGRLDRFQ